MNKIINKIYFTTNKFMLEFHLRQPGFTYKDCGLLTKNKGRIQKFKETILLEIQVMIDMNVHLFQSLINFMIKSLQVAVLKMILYQIKN